MSFSNNSRFGKKNNKVNLDNLACCQRRVLTNWWRVNDVLNQKISLLHQLTKKRGEKSDRKYETDMTLDINKNKRTMYFNNF